MAIDGDFGIDYQLRILEHMVAELPSQIGSHFQEQCAAIRSAIARKDEILADMMRQSLADLRLDVISQQHDLEATRRERAILAQRLKDAGLNDKA